MKIRPICTIALLITLTFVFTPSVYVLAKAGQARIQGEYCYQYGDSESLMIAKEISYAMALRKAIETYKTFISSTSIVKDFKLKKDIIEAIASGYVDNIKIIKQDIKGRTVCTTLIGYVNPDAVKSIISRKVEKVRKTKRKEFKGLVSNNALKILSIKKSGQELFILYQAKREIKSYSSLVQEPIMVDCFDGKGNPMPGKSTKVPSYGTIYKGEVREAEIVLPSGTMSYEVRLRHY